LSALVQAVLLAVRDRVRRARLAGLQAARGNLRDPRTGLHDLLLRVFPGYPAAPRHLREDQAAAEFNFGICAGRESVSGEYDYEDASYHRRSRTCRLCRRVRAGDRPRARHAEPANAEVVFFRPVRPLRPGTTPTRLQDLQGSLPSLPLDTDAGFPQLGRSRWSGLLGSAGSGSCL